MILKELYACDIESLPLDINSKKASNENKRKTASLTSKSSNLCLLMLVPYVVEINTLVSTFDLLRYVFTTIQSVRKRC